MQMQGSWALDWVQLWHLRTPSPRSPFPPLRSPTGNLFCSQVPLANWRAHNSSESHNRASALSLLNFSAHFKDYTVMKISGCVALVTGGASGIGRGLCEVLLQRNAKVFIATLDSSERMRKFRKFHEFVERLNWPLQAVVLWLKCG